MQHTSSLPAPARNSKSVCALNIKCQFSLRNLIKGSAQPEYHANLATLNCRTTIENLLQHSILSEFANESHPSNDREYAKNIFIKRLLCIGIALAGLSAHLDEFGRVSRFASQGRSPPAVLSELRPEGFRILSTFFSQRFLEIWQRIF